MATAQNHQSLLEECWLSLCEFAVPTNARSTTIIIASIVLNLVVVVLSLAARWQQQWRKDHSSADVCPNRSA